MGLPVAETPPQGLDAYWLGVWRHALKVQQEQGSWAWELKPLLDEYVFALIAAKEFRGEDQDAKWDRAAKRAQSLADQLALTARGRKAAGVAILEDDQPGDPFAALDAEDELARRRRAS
jgi:hypothetical protein